MTLKNVKKTQQPTMMMAAKAKCKNLYLVVLLLFPFAATSQTYIPEYRVNCINKTIFSEYDLSFVAYNANNNDITVEEFEIKVEFSSLQLDSISSKLIKNKIVSILLGDSSNDKNFEDIIKDYIQTEYLDSYKGRDLIIGNEETQKFISEIKAKNSLTESDLFWEPVSYHKTIGKLLFFTNMFLSYSITKETTDASISSARTETVFTFDIVNKKFITEEDILFPESIELYNNLINNSISNSQKILLQKSIVKYNGNFYIDDKGITYVFNTKRSLPIGNSMIYVLIDPKAFRPMVNTESVVYKYFNIGQVERTKAGKANKVI